jgi:predicted TIM-barrel fold metal-dependent hydrolase
MNRRQFFQTAAAAATVSRLAAQDEAPNWGTNVIDVHLHPRQQADAEWTHMQGCGVTHAVLLTNARAVPHAKEEIAKRPDRLKLFVGVDPGSPDAIETLRAAVKDGAIGFGEMKSRFKADGPEMLKVYALAGELGVPVTIHFGDVPQFAGDIAYNEGILRFPAVIKANPKTTFIGHADSFWANVSAEIQDTAYPSGKIKPGGVSDKMLTDFPNLYGDMSANSCRNALGRDPEFMAGFLKRHQDKLMFGSDCSCRDGRGTGQGSQAPLIKGKCVARETLTAVKGMVSPEIFRKIAWGNAARLLKFKA